MMLHFLTATTVCVLFFLSSSSATPYQSLLSSINISAVVGHVLQDEELCPCTNLGDNDKAVNIMAAVDKKTNRDFVSNYPIDSGLVVSTSHHAPLRRMKICSNQDCPECDPCAYKIEGMNETVSANNFEFIQEGPLTMPTERGACVEIPIDGQHQYTEYKVTFPCLTGGFDSCSNELPPSAWEEPRSPGCEEDCLGEFAELGYQWSEYMPGKDSSFFVYSYRNFMNDQTGQVVSNLDHITFPFMGECRFEEVFFVRNPDTPDHEFVYNTTDITLFTQERDLDLCMYGAKISSITPEGEQMIVGDNQYSIVVKLKGNVEATQNQYGIYGQEGRRDYQYTMLPDCTDTVFQYCENYPMKISELDLLGECEQFTAVESEQRRSSSCTICDDVIADHLKIKGKTCNDLNLQTKCNKHALWIIIGLCRLSCYNEGLGYEGDVCCTDTL